MVYCMLKITIKVRKNVDMDAKIDSSNFSNKYINSSENIAKKIIKEKYSLMDDFHVLEKTLSSEKFYIKRKIIIGLIPPKISLKQFNAVKLKYPLSA